MLRGIDKERGLYFLLTPVDPSVLRSVNCLLLGAILLPSCIFTSQVRVQTSARAFVFFRAESERCLCPPAWLRRRDAVPDHRLQLRPQRGRKAAHLQGADPTQPRGAPLSQVLASSSHARCLLLLQGPPTLSPHVQQVPESSSTCASGRSVDNQEFPSSDGARSRSFCGTLALVGQSELWVEQEQLKAPPSAGCAGKLPLLTSLLVLLCERDSSVCVISSSTRSYVLLQGSSGMAVNVREASAGSHL